MTSARRRRILQALAAAAFAGPGVGATPAETSRAAPAGARRRSPPRYFTPDELALVASVALEVLPLPDVLDGTVDIAQNLDSYLARFPRYDLGRIKKGIRLLNASLTYALARVLGQATALDRVAVSKYLVTLGYYGDGNGEADLPAAARRIWPRLGYGGPLPQEFAGFRPAATFDPGRLADRLAETDPLRYLSAKRVQP